MSGTEVALIAFVAFAVSGLGFAFFLRCTAIFLGITYLST